MLDLGESTSIHGFELHPFLGPFLTAQFLLRSLPNFTWMEKVSGLFGCLLFFLVPSFWMYVGMVKCYHAGTIPGGTPLLHINFVMRTLAAGSVLLFSYNKTNITFQMCFLKHPDFEPFQLLNLFVTTKADFVMHYGDQTLCTINKIILNVSPRYRLASSCKQVKGKSIR